MTLLGALLGSSVWPWEAFLRQNYLGPDTRLETGYSPTYRNRFRTAWVGKPVDPLGHEVDAYYYSEKRRRMISTPTGQRPLGPVTAAFERALAEVLECAPRLRRYRDDLFPWEVVPTEHGAVTSFFMTKHLSTKPGHALQLSSFVVRTARGCTSPEIQPQEVDLDYGGPNRQVWDLLTLRGEQFVVVACHEYEAQSIELYRLHEIRWKRVLEFEFATLGG